MSRQSRIVWLDDQITAAVREQPNATTAEVCRAFCSTCRSTTPYHHYSLLRQPAKAGTIRWTATGTTTTWQVSAAAVDQTEVDALEAAFQLELEPPAMSTTRREQVMTRYTAQVEDPTTGMITEFEASSSAELDRMVEARLAEKFPEPDADEQSGE